MFRNGKFDFEMFSLYVESPKIEDFATTEAKSFGQNQCRFKNICLIFQKIH